MSVCEQASETKWKSFNLAEIENVRRLIANGQFIEKYILEITIYRISFSLKHREYLRFNLILSKYWEIITLLRTLLQCNAASLLLLLPNTKQPYHIFLSERMNLIHIFTPLCLGKTENTTHKLVCLFIQATRKYSASSVSAFKSVYLKMKAYQFLDGEYYSLSCR